MLAAGRIGHEDQPRHPRLEHDRVRRIELHDDPLADAADVANRAPDDAAAKVIDPRRDRDRLAPAGHALDVRDPRPPTMPKMPRRIVSTSGSSGMS